jgi:hypothetical protein
VREREHGPGVDEVRVGTDGPAVDRIQSGPAAAHSELGRDARQGVTGRNPVADGRLPAGQHQNGTGVDDVRVGTDGPAVGRIQSGPAAAHGELGRDAG